MTLSSPLTNAPVDLAGVVDAHFDGNLLVDRAKATVFYRLSGWERREYQMAGTILREASRTGTCAENGTTRAKPPSVPSRGRRSSGSTLTALLVVVFSRVDLRVFAREVDVGNEEVVGLVGRRVRAQDDAVRVEVLVLVAAEGGGGGGEGQVRVCDYGRD